MTTDLPMFAKSPVFGVSMSAASLGGPVPFLQG
jgi:hypothetical protein